ncbi:MAG TPA: NAD(P)H-dependent oxidoreductase [Proteiniphilum sp.]|nr:NAD(P)H-dependent oxidoreductase [Proteiniphilum sp.]HPD86325.1 NAD(P)H-dependent oxidoreductase [Proteiniphilum sp.]HPJ49224.1 NAD(P)H-dependent oxidoreductase [Proteiniphilum sp.]HPR20739.1 NAD(P)H-dependent oxidoreductase [Proteiniphilum sp.]
MNIIEPLNWRYATKRMTGGKLPEKELQSILEAIRLAPSAYGLQPYRVIVTENRELIEQIYEQSCPQVVLQQCSHLLIFKAKKRLDEAYVEGFLEEFRSVRNATDLHIDSYREKIHRVINDPTINTFSWTTHQTYLALGYATFAAAQLGIDATPIEGFNPKALNRLLSLDEEKEETVLMLTLGYRDAGEDRLAHQPKVRKPLHKLVERL